MADISIESLLRFAHKHNASDLHISAGLPAMIRVDGEIVKGNMRPMEHITVHSLIYAIMNDKQRSVVEACFSYHSFQSIDDGRLRHGRSVQKDFVV